MGVVNDIKGRKFERLSVVEQRGVNKYGRALWLCECKCGNTLIVEGVRLTSGVTKSCGCLKRQRAIENGHKNKTHGMSKRNRLYRAWGSMKSRCYDVNHEFFKDYGGRGIAVCDEWKDSFEAFRDWAFESGFSENALRKDCTLDRKDNNGDYCPDNCRWATMENQCNNRRNTVMFMVDGVRTGRAEAARKLGIPYHVLRFHPEIAGGQIK